MDLNKLDQNVGREAVNDVFEPGFNSAITVTSSFSNGSNNSERSIYSRQSRLDIFLSQKNSAKLSSQNQHSSSKSPISSSSTNKTSNQDINHQETLSNFSAESMAKSNSPNVLSDDRNRRCAPTQKRSPRRIRRSSFSESSNSSDLSINSKSKSKKSIKRKSSKKTKQRNNEKEFQEGNESLVLSEGTTSTEDTKSESSIRQISTVKQVQTARKSTSGVPRKPLPTKEKDYGMSILLSIF